MYNISRLLLYNLGMNSKEPITSRQNKLIKKIRALGKRKARKESTLFLVEGIRHVGTAVEADWQIETLLYAPDLLTSDYARDLISASTKKGIYCQPASTDVFRSIAGKDNPQGILATVHQRAPKLRDLANVQRAVALLSPQDPGNLGTILRTMDAVGADGLILLDGGVELYHPTVVRASMGALFWIPTVRAAFNDFQSWARDRDLPLIGTSAHGAVDLSSLQRMTEQWILLLGSEQKGLTEEQSAACDTLVSLPMRGHGTSLNLAVAAGIFLHELTR